MDDLYKYFRIEARELSQKLSQGLLRLEREDASADLVSELLRHAHTLKGAARVVRQPTIAELAHAIEDLLLPLREGAGTADEGLIDAALRQVDAIATELSGLDGPAALEPGTEAPVAPAPAYFASDSNTAELDALITHIADAYTESHRLHAAAELAGRIGRLADTLVNARSVPARMEAPDPTLDGIHAAAEQVRQLARRLAQTIGTTQQRLDRALRQGKQATEQLRLLPAQSLFPAVERTVRDAARTLGRQVVFEGTGGEVWLEAPTLRIVQDALVQIARNAVAHGIEPPDERRDAMKPIAGSVRVDITVRGRRIVFRCADDGRGIDIDAVRRTAIRKGMPSDELSRLDAEGIVNLMLKGGLSTSAAVSEVSGRGIGLDILRDALARLGGDVVVRTEAGIGTIFEISAPLSTSAAELLRFESASHRAALPLAVVQRVSRIRLGDIRRTPAGPTLLEDDQALPLVALESLLGNSGDRPPTSDYANVVVIAASGGTKGIIVDRLLDITIATVRPLPDLTPAAEAVSGCGIDPDGIPFLVLDPEAVLRSATVISREETKAPLDDRPLLVIDDSLTTRLLEQSILETAGFSVDLAVSAEEGLDLVRRNDYALILCDIEMPGMDGFTFTERLREDPAFRDLPVFLVTSRDAAEDRQRGKDVGAQEYIVKSAFDQVWLIQRIREHLG